MVGTIDNGNVFWGWEESYERGQTHWGEWSQELAPLRNLSEARGRIVCVPFWWFRLYKVQIYISQDDGAGGRSLRRWERWIKKGVKSYRMGEGRQAARQGSPFPSTASFSMWSGVYSHWQEWRKELGQIWHIQPTGREWRSHALSRSPWVLRGFLAFETPNTLLYWVGGKSTDQASDHSWA